MSVLAPVWREIPLGGSPWAWPFDGADDLEPVVPCDACGVMVMWAPPLGDHVDIETTSPHECQP